MVDKKTAVIAILTIAAILGWGLYLNKSRTNISEQTPEPTLTPETTITPEPTPTPKEEKTFPKNVTLPFSWEEDEDGYLTDITEKKGIVKVTVVNITALGKTLEKIGLSSEAEEGYQYYGVYVTGKNLQNREWSCPYGVYIGTNFELKTNRTNIYKTMFFGSSDVRFGFGSPMKPEEEEEGWARFEIREDEKPIELRHYEVINPEAPLEKRELGLVYIWKIEG